MRRNARRLILILTTGIFLLCGALLFGGVTASYIRKINRTLEEENRIRMAETGENIRTYMNAVIDNNRSLLLNAAVALAAVREENRMSYLEKMQEQDHFVYIGYDVNYVSNFTDVDDKIIAKANEEGVTAEEISQRYIEECKKDMAGMNVKPATTNPLATQEIEGMIQLIQTLMDKGYAYEKNGTVYYRTRQFKEYG